MSRRVPVAIAALPGHDNHQPKLIALCNDGTLWSCSHSSDWQRCTPVPQGDDRGDPVPLLSCARCAHAAPHLPSEIAVGTPQRCGRPGLAETHNLVTGKPARTAVYCQDERQDVPGRCGREGSYFMQRTPK